MTEYESIRKDVLREAKLIMENNMTNIKQAWIDALKSGKYIHGQKRLKIVGEEQTMHCCLGVLVEVLGDEIVGRSDSCPVSDDPIDQNRLTGNRIKTKDGVIHSYNYFDEILDLADGFRLSDLYTTNDAWNVKDYTLQIKWIERNVIAVEQKDQ